MTSKGEAKRKGPPNGIIERPSFLAPMFLACTLLLEHEKPFAKEPSFELFKWFLVSLAKEGHGNTMNNLLQNSRF